MLRSLVGSEMCIRDSFVHCLLQSAWFCVPLGSFVHEPVALSQVYVGQSAAHLSASSYGPPACNTHCLSSLHAYVVTLQLSLQSFSLCVLWPEVSALHFPVVVSQVKPCGGGAVHGLSSEAVALRMQYPLPLTAVQYGAWVNEHEEGSKTPCGQSLGWQCDASSPLVSRKASNMDAACLQYHMTETRVARQACWGSQV